MTTMTPARPLVTGGVDTHRDEHVAAGLDHNGGLLATASFPTTAAGYAALLAWLLLTTWDLVLRWHRCW